MDAQLYINAINDKGRKVIEEELSQDPLWIEASKKTYKLLEDKDFSGDDAQAVQYGLDKMSEFNNNVSFGTIPHTAKVVGADDESQVAYAYLMDTYEQKDITMAGFGRGVKEAFLDPLNYVGLSTFGIGTVAKKGAQEAGKEGFKLALKSAVERFAQSNVAKGVAGGAMYAGGQTLAEENIKASAGLQEGVDYGNVATSGAIGAVVGGTVVKGAEKLGSMYKQGGEELQRMAGGGTADDIARAVNENINMKKFSQIREKYDYINSEQKDIKDNANSELFQFSKKLEEKYGLKSFFAYADNKGIKLDTIIVDKENQKQGRGTSVMRELIEYADENKMPIYLTTAVKDDFAGTTSSSRLKKFYKEFGFVENKGRNIDYSISGNMYRLPKNKTN